MTIDTTSGTFSSPGWKSCNGEATSAAGFLRNPILIGSASMLILVATISLWSSLAPLVSATLAVGTVVVEGNRRVVQHLEGGIVRALVVSDGDHVTQGDILIELDDTRLISALKTLEPLLSMITAQRARLEAERLGMDSIDFPDKVGDLNLSNFPSAREDQLKNFIARQGALNGRTRILRADQTQSQETLAGLQQQAGSYDIRISMVEEDARVAAYLAREGNGTRQHVRDMNKVVAELQGERSGLNARVGETKQKIEHAKAEIDRVQEAFIESVEAEIQQIDREQLDISARYRNEVEQLSRMHIEAPVSGRIVNLVVHTVGGVVSPGLPLLEIVPDNDRLIIEAQIKPSDISSVKKGQSVKVRVSGADARRTPLLEGAVISVSADRLQDRQRGNNYFLVRVEVPSADPSKLRPENFRVGMSVDLMIAKGEQTIFEYMVSPLVAFFANSMHE